MGAAAAVHPNEPTLQAYGLGKLDDASAESVNKHLSSCPDCQRRVAEMSSDSFLGGLRDVQGGTLKSAADWAHSSVSLTDPRAPIANSPPAVDTMPPGLAEHPDYEVIRELGRGGMGVVYLAHNRLLGRDEVLKVMSRHIMERPGLLARFQAEMRAVAKLHHPNIVTAYSAFRLGESILFAMEYVEGLDLARLVKAKGPLPVANACYFVNQAAQGMQHAHDRGMVHRDIKPGNLMLSHEGKRALIKVLDFGLAKATREEPVDGGLTNPGQALGTPDYMAPEQIRDAQKADIRADVYSLGCTLYYLLSGGPPFRAQNLWDLYQAHHSMDAKLLNFVRPDVPSELASLVAKMMAKEPERRFQTPVEVAQALTPFFKKGSAAMKGMNDVGSQVGKPELNREPAGAGSVSASPAPKMATAAPERAPATAAHRDPMWESLIEFKETETVKEATTTVAAPGPGRPPWMWPAVAAASFVGMLALGVIIWVTFGARRGDKNQASVVEHEPTHEAPGAASTNAQPIPTKETKADTRVPSDGFEPLFNGNDLSGWTVSLGSNTDWNVEDGSIRGAGTSSACEIASARSDYEDFHLRMEVRTFENLCKRLIIRASRAEDDAKNYFFWTGAMRPRGPTAFLGEYRFKTAIVGNQLTTDGLREITAPSIPGLALSTWQRVEIIAVGNIFRMRVDNREVSAFEDTESRLKRGQIAFQVPRGSQFQIRKIEIKELNRQAAHGAEAKQTAASPSAVNTRTQPIPGQGDYGKPATRLESDGFQSLFDGKTLEGWNVERGDASNWGWGVEAGAIVARGQDYRTRNYLLTDRDYADFDLRLEFKFEKGSGSGLIVRAKPGEQMLMPGGKRFPDHPNFKLIESAGREETGSTHWIRDNTFVKPDRSADLKPAGSWNLLEVQVKGHAMLAVVNHKTVLDTKLDPGAMFSDGTVPALNRASGRIGLQKHTGTVRFRNIEIRDLSRMRNETRTKATRKR